MNVVLKSNCGFSLQVPLQTRFVTTHLTLLSTHCIYLGHFMSNLEDIYSTVADRIPLAETSNTIQGQVSCFNGFSLPVQPQAVIGKLGT